jgi:hypothetical protein
VPSGGSKEQGLVLCAVRTCACAVGWTTRAWGMIGGSGARGEPSAVRWEQEETGRVVVCMAHMVHVL